MNPWGGAALAAGIALGAAACSPSAPAPDTVRVFAAASLAAPFEELAAAFERRHPGLRVELHCAGSAQLALQLREGARADVFASADVPNMDKVVGAGATCAAPVTLVTNRLAVVVPVGNPKGIRSLADLARGDLAVALCGPEVPAGRYAREALASAGVEVRSRSDEGNVRALVAKVQLGELDACIAFATDARARGVEGIALPPQHDVTATYPVAVLRSGTNEAGGHGFVAFAQGDEGRAVLVRHGFGVP